MDAQWDVIIIGAGAAGLNIMSFAHRVGLRILLITDKESSIGGDCLNTGCIPSKALLHAAKSIYTSKQAQKKFFRLPNNQGASILANESSINRINGEAIFAHIKKSIDTIKEHETLEYFRGTKDWSILVGTAHFTGKNSISVDGKEYSSKKIIIATGSRPKHIDIDGAEYVTIHTNETIFKSGIIPQNLVVVGCGPVGLELGQAFAMIGSKVTIVDRSDTFCNKEDHAIGQVLKKSFDKMRINFIARATVTKITPEKIAVISFQNKIGKYEEMTVPCDTVLVSAGRDVSYSKLSLENAGVHLKENGIIKSDTYLRTTNKNIFVAGDAAGPPFFTHVTELHASVILANLFTPRVLWKKLSFANFSWVTYTHPEIGTFGMNKQQLKENEIAYTTLTKKYKENDRMITEDVTDGLIKIYIDKKQRVLGGSIVGDSAGELIQEYILLAHLKKPLSSLISKTYAYPTKSRLNKEVAFMASADRLTDKAKKLLRLTFSIFN